MTEPVSDTETMLVPDDDDGAAAGRRTKDGAPTPDGHRAAEGDNGAHPRDADGHGGVISIVTQLHPGADGDGVRVVGRGARVVGRAERSAVGAGTRRVARTSCPPATPGVVGRDEGAVRRPPPPGPAVLPRSEEGLEPAPDTRPDGARRAPARRRPIPAPRAARPRRHATWRGALGAGLVCFGVWLVLDAPALLRSAQSGPLGVRRTVAIAVLRPIDDLSRALGLSHAIPAVDRAIGRNNSGVLQQEGPPVRTARSGRSHHGAPGAARHPYVTTPVTTPDGLAPLPTPSAGAPLRVLAVGDSLGIDFGQVLVNDLAATGVVNAVLDGHIDTGLSRPDYFDWPAELQSALSRYQPQAVVVFIGANDPQSFVEGSSAVTYGTLGWSEAYASRVASFMQAATSAGARVLWVGMPPMADPVLNAKMQVLNGIYQTEVTSHPGVTYLPSWTVLSDSQGGFATFLPDLSGNEVQVREPDGTHISPSGAERLSRAAIAAMDHAWSLSL